MLKKNEFDILDFLKRTTTKVTQRSIAQATDLSVGTVNKVLENLEAQELIDNKKTLTDKGIEALEPYRVKRAVIIAAGIGERMIPVTLNTPKPLVRVNGVRIIDTLLDAIYSAGINEVYIVRGYLSEQFDQLLYKYPNIHFIENPIYNESNNISSVVCASYLLKNAYILEGDLLLKNQDLIRTYQYYSNYLAIPVDKTDDWCVKVDNKNAITKIAIGGTHCWQVAGISYWTEEDGAKLVGHAQEVYNAPGGKERFWDQVALEYHIKDYKGFAASMRTSSVRAGGVTSPRKPRAASHSRTYSLSSLRWSLPAAKSPS